MGYKEQFIQIQLDSKRQEIKTLAGGYSIYSEVYDGFYNHLDNYPDINVIEKRSEDFYYKCAQFVFAKVYKEPWCRIDVNAPTELWEEPVEFLSEKKFNIVESPRENDVVVYGDFDDNDFFGQKKFTARHFGIYLKDKLVISKLGTGSIVRHPLELVPVEYGTHFLFMRKQL